PFQVHFFQRLRGRAGGQECVMRMVIPVKKALLAAANKIGHMDFNRMLLADAVKTANTLRKQGGMQRQVKQEQVVGELEVTSFTADFRAQQDLCAVFIVGKPGSGAVTLNDAHAFVESGGGNTGTHA